MDEDRRTRSRSSARPSLSVVFVTAAVVVVSVGCGEDPPIRVVPIARFLQAAQIVGGWPAVRDGSGGWVRQCGEGAPEGFLVNVALVSAPPQLPDDFGVDGAIEVEIAWDQIDNDLSIRPAGLHPSGKGDEVNGRVVEGSGDDAIHLHPSTVFLDIDCIDPVPDADEVGAQSCQGPTGGGTLESIRYVETRRAGTKRREGHEVLILIDQSGSMSGLVHAEDQEDALKESDEPQLSTSFGQYASDPQLLRLLQAKLFVKRLNPEDQVGVIAFGTGLPNGRFDVPCAIEGAGDDASGVDDFVTASLDLCFGTDHAIWTEGGIDSLGAADRGRANLWDAVDVAWEYLASRPPSKRSKHILVITDGPDTCLEDGDRLGCDPICGGLPRFEDFVDRIESAAADPKGPEIHVHFVQFEALGYPGRDPRQVEVACRTGGHYQFIDSNSMPHGSAGPLLDALEQAIWNVRRTLMGHWQLAFASPAFADDSPLPNGSPKGSLYALSGTLTVTRATKLLDQDRPFPFGVGLGYGANLATSWDRRPTLRKPCSGPADCGAAADAGSDCHVVCDARTLLCPNGAEGAPVVDNSVCLTADGFTGFCCLSEGGDTSACQSTGICPACMW